LAQPCLELAAAHYSTSFQGRKLIPLAGMSFATTLRDDPGDRSTSCFLEVP
jgi:hypothetical protein